MILTRKSDNCAGTAFVQGDSAGGSKLTERTLYSLRFDSVEIYLWAACHAFSLHHSMCKALCYELVSDCLVVCPFLGEVRQVSF